MLILCLFSESKQSLKTLAEACFRFSPRISLGKNAVFIDIKKSLSLFSKESLLVKSKITALRLGVQVKQAISPDVPSSYVFAKYQCQDLLKLPISCCTDFLDPMGSATIQQSVLQSMISTLEVLGVQTIQDFLLLPSHSLKSRFGPISQNLLLHIQNGNMLPWAQYEPPKIITEQHTFSPDDCCMQLDLILFELKKLIDIITKRIYARHLRASKVQITMDLERYSTTKNNERQWIIEFPMAQTAASTILSVITERLIKTLERSPLESPVNKIQLKILETTPGHRGQKNLFDSTEEQEENWNSLVARISEKIGTDQIFKASPNQNYLPEKSWTKALPLFKPVTIVQNLPYPNRPLELFSPPRSLSRVGDYVFDGSIRYKISSFEQCEKISSQWWSADYFDRLYYKVNASSGQNLWIFKDLKTQVLYLHGIF